MTVSLQPVRVPMYLPEGGERGRGGLRLGCKEYVPAGEGERGLGCKVYVPAREGERGFRVRV